MLREEEAYWEPPAIMEAITELKNWAWEGVVNLMEDSVRKIKTIKSVTFAKKIETVKLVTLAKNVVSVPIESIFASVSIPIKYVCDSFLVKNSFPFNMNSDYLLALNAFISKIGKETLNNKELKHGYLEPIKEET